MAADVGAAAVVASDAGIVHTAPVAAAAGPAAGTEAAPLGSGGDYGSVPGFRIAGTRAGCIGHIAGFLGRWRKRSAAAVGVAGEEGGTSALAGFGLVRESKGQVFGWRRRQTLRCPVAVVAGGNLRGVRWERDGEKENEAKVDDVRNGFFKG